MKSLFNKVLWTSMLVFFSMNLWAQQSPDQVIRSVVDEMFTTLKSEKEAIKTNSNQLVAIVNKIIIPHTDVNETSKRVLAKHWRNLTGAQQQAFEKEFEQLLIRTYAISFRAYDQQVVDILETRFNPNNPNLAEVRTIIKQPAKPNLPVYYRFLKETDGAWKVYDIIVENVSLVSSFRTQIGDQITREGFDKMIANMHAKNQEKF